MIRKYPEITESAARIAAALLFIAIAPATLLRIAATCFRGGRLAWKNCTGNQGAFRVPMLVRHDGQHRPMWLPGIVSGHMAFIGPEPIESPAGALTRRPGMISPSRVQIAAGISHVTDAASDEAFFVAATLTQRVGLICRYAMSRLLAATPGEIDPEKSLIEIFGVRINAVSMNSAVDTLVEWGKALSDTGMKIVSFVNPDCLNKASQDREYHYLLGRADMVLPDGSGLRIAAKLLRVPLHDNVNGTDLFPLLCEAAAQKGHRLFLFGGLPGVAADAAQNMQERFPMLQIAGHLDGHRKLDEGEAVEMINASGADILLVGLGAPLQEKWLHEHQHELDVAVGIGVGGLFDYYSGRISRAPLWLREAGLEWIWRILQEPAAKWRRYIVGNPVFLWKVMREKRTRAIGIEAHRLQRRLPTPAEMRVDRSSTPRRESIRARFARRTWKAELMLRRIAKRALDVGVAGTALVCLGPLLLVTALAIRIESPGPILFRQIRVGARGKTFSMLKFRSMFVDAEARLAALQSRNESAGGVLFKMKDDPRITRIGKFIRRYSIDELPQIINVLRGDMSIVGPRPALPSEVARYASSERKRLQAKPGLTCLWQIGGRSDLSFEQQVELDVEYLKRQSLMTDVRIIAGTVPAVIAGKGAY